VITASPATLRRLILQRPGTLLQPIQPKPLPNLQRFNLMGGGPGSGCHGDQCGRPAGSGSEQSRAERASATYKPSTREKQRIADESERDLSIALKMDRTPDNAAFDLKIPAAPPAKGVGVEIKTFIDNSNSKITMHKESLARKVKAAKKEKLNAHTVVVDKREPGTERYFYRKGVGSFYLRTMKEVSIKELRGILIA